MNRVIIIGNYGGGNVGDEAILMATIDELRADGVKYGNIVVPSRNPEKLYELHGNIVFILKNLVSII